MKTKITCIELTTTEKRRHPISLQLVTVMICSEMQHGGNQASIEVTQRLLYFSLQLKSKRHLVVEISIRICIFLDLG